MLVYVLVCITLFPNSFAIIETFRCRVIVYVLLRFLTLPWVDLQFVIVVFLIILTYYFKHKILDSFVLLTYIQCQHISKLKYL